MLDKSRVELKIGGYGIAPAAALEDPALLGRVQGYRRQTGGRMMALDRQGVKVKVPNSDYHVSRKIDGEFTVLIWNGSEAVTLNPGGTVRVGLPVLEEAAEKLRAAGATGALLATELFVERVDGKRARVHDVTRVARRPESAEALDSLHLAVFDVIEWNGEEPGAGFAESWKHITDTFGDGKRIRPVEAVTCKTAKEILSRFEKWVDDEGSEGLVARSDSAGISK